MKSVIIVIVSISILFMGSIGLNIYQWNNPKILEIKVPAKITEDDKTKIINEYIAKTAEENLNKMIETEAKEKKEGVIRVDEKNHIIPQGLYELSGWIFTPAGHHIAHGSPVYVQFNYLTTSIMSPCGAKLKPVKTVPTKVVIIQIGTKPTETVVAQADTPSTPTPAPASTPKPTPTPAPKPTPTPAPAPAPTPCGKPINLGKYEEWSSVAGYIISGDIEFWNGIMWQPLYDNKAETALLVVIKTTGIKIRAPYGASGNCDTPLESFKSQKLSEGFTEIIVKEL